MQRQPDLHIDLAVKDNSVAPFARWGLQFYSFKTEKIHSSSVHLGQKPQCWQADHNNSPKLISNS